MRWLFSTPKTVQEFIQVGEKYALKRQYKKAIWAFTQAIELEPQNAPAYRERADAYIAIKAYDAALEDLNIALKLTPAAFIEIYFDRAEVYLYAEQYAPAIKEYTRILEHDPRHEDALSGRAIAYTEAGNLKRAIADYTTLIQYYPDVTDYHHACDELLAKGDDK